MPNKDSETLQDQEAKEVSGGGWFSQWSDEQYRAGGVEIVGPGILWNSGYKFRGKKIETFQANALALYANINGHPADSVEEAVVFYDNWDPRRRDGE